MPHLDVATINIRNIADRWPERLPLLLSDMAALQPDLLGIQECVFAVNQDRLLGAAGEGRYEIHRGWAGRPEYGNSVLVKAPLASAGDPERLDLGPTRSALRVLVARAGADPVAMVVTHLHHVPADEAEREAQARSLVAWLADRPAPGGTIVVGDFNAEPVEPAYRVMVEAGFRSALRRGERRRARRHVAVGDPGAGHGRRRRTRLPRLHLAARSAARDRLPAGVRPSRGRRSDALPVRPPGASRPASRSSG